jgi:asparagine synthetase B (glutamine-hydrolysing)
MGAWERDSGVFYCRRASPSAQATSVCEAMGARMRHQPYCVVDIGSPTPPVALGRIAIGLLNRATQPLRGADDQVWLCLCGEFYHQRERRMQLIGSGVLH